MGKLGHEPLSSKTSPPKGQMGSRSLLCMTTWGQDRVGVIICAEDQMRGEDVIIPALGDQTGVRIGGGHLLWGPSGRQVGMEEACPLAHSPLELLLALGQALAFVPHQVQDSASHLLLEDTPVPTDAQAAEGGWGDTMGLGGGPIRPACPTRDQRPLTPAHCRSPWAGRGCRTPGPAAGPPPAASWLLGRVLAAAASGPRPL